MIKKILQFSAYTASLLLGIFLPQFTQAQGFAGLVETGVTTVANHVGAPLISSLSYGVSMLLYGIFYFIFWVNGLLFELFGFLINFALTLNISILQNEVVLSGWVAVRDITNLALIFGVILIAVMTILGREEYGLRSYLTTLFVMALLINFTFVIAGVFLDASGVFTNYFMNKISSGANGINLSDSLATALGVSGFLDITNFYSATGADFFDASKAGSESSKILSVATKLGLVTLFMISATVVLGIIAIMFFLRWLILAILLIIAPLAWIMYAFPGMTDYTKRWWNTFFQWIFFLPVSMFFIYLAVLAVTNYAHGVNGTLLGAFSEAMKSTGGTLKGTFDNFTQLILAMGLLIASVFAGQAVGGAGGSLMFNIADRSRRAALGLVTGGAGLAGRSGLRSYLTGGGEHGQPPRGKRIEKIFASLGMVGAANAVGGMMQGYEHEAIEYQKNQFANLSDESVLALAKKRYTGIEGAAMAKELVDRKLLKKLSDNPTEREEITKHYIGEAEKVGVGHEILKSRPDLAHSAEETAAIASKLGARGRATLTTAAYTGKYASGPQANQRTEQSIALLRLVDRATLQKMGEETETDNMKAVVDWIPEEIANIATDYPNPAALTDKKQYRNYVDRINRVNELLDFIRQSGRNPLWRPFITPALPANVASVPHPNAAFNQP